MVFDIDTMENITAKQYFKDIKGLYTYIIEKIGLAPTYILETNKGFHFAYHLKNHIYTNQKKALNYVIAIKQTITEILGCDTIASHKLYGVWRNPLLHNCCYSKQINYELKDFKSLLPKKEYSNSKRKISINIKDEDLEIGNRNIAFFKYALKFAYNQNSLTANDIFDFLENINSSKNVNLENKELLTISPTGKSLSSAKRALYEIGEDTNEMLDNMVYFKTLLKKRITELRETTNIGDNERDEKITACNALMKGIIENQQNLIKQIKELPSLIKTVEDLKEGEYKFIEL